MRERLGTTRRHVALPGKLAVGSFSDPPRFAGRVTSLTVPAWKAGRQCAETFDKFRYGKRRPKPLVAVRSQTGAWERN
ncbi:hypothetical protein Rcae01_01198 [Novipirellula caenicola]|uniref:Uncharacterized protein n=1 Tax=Novipirellula caenicola TaxID=1536901 RepID=A0ABP9VLU6_9BACT